MSSPDSDGLFLHASAVVAEGGALLFLGHSTAGKSTIADLLQKNYDFLSDDAVFTNRDPNGVWRVVDGKFRLENVEVFNWETVMRQQPEIGSGIPLRGCIRIYKSLSVKLAGLAPVETARCLMDAVMEIDVQRKFGRLQDKTGGGKPDVALVRRMRSAWFHNAADIARACTGWRLWFPRDSHVPDLICAVDTIAARSAFNQIDEFR